jgi:hypothetical protein
MRLDTFQIGVQTSACHATRAAIRKMKRRTTTDEEKEKEAKPFVGYTHPIIIV